MRVNYLAEITTREGGTMKTKLRIIRAALAMILALTCILPMQGCTSENIGDIVDNMEFELTTSQNTFMKDEDFTVNIKIQNKNNQDVDIFIVYNITLSGFIKGYICTPQEVASGLTQRGDSLLEGAISIKQNSTINIVITAYAQSAYSESTSLTNYLIVNLSDIKTADTIEKSCQMIYAVDQAVEGDDDGNGNEII